MEKMKQKFEQGKRLLTHRIDSCKLKPGDHIYTYRALHSYTHHGIYVGEDRVIHFIPTEINGFSKPEQKQPCENCKYQHNVHRGVVKTCLNCFLSDSVFSSNSLCLYEYEESSFVKMLKISGTCSTSKCLRPPEEVVQVANNLYEKKDFDSYGLIGNNCEHFATYCKTGTRCSAQVDGFMSVPIIGSLVNKMKNKLSS